MKTVYLFHGWGGSARTDWFPWLSQQLRAEGYTVICPDLPNTAQPKMNEWLEFIKRYTFDTDSVLVGHSLGTVLIFRFLELRSRPVGHVYLAAPLDEDLGIAELRQSEFFAAPFDWEKIKHSAKSFSLFYSDDDPYIGVPMFERVAVHLGARQYFLPGRGHFNSQAWPELFEAIIAQRNNEAKKQ